MNYPSNTQFATTTSETRSRRQASAMRSLRRWHDFQAEALEREEALSREALERSDDPARRAELRNAMDIIRLEKMELETRWGISSLRRTTGGGEVEERNLHPVMARYYASERAGGGGHGSPGTLSGYGSIFNSDSQDLGGYIEQVAPGAFADALAGGDCLCLFNHNADNLLGRQSSGTMTLKEDSHGLHFTCELPNDGLGWSTRERVSRGDLCGCSFSFTVAEDEWLLPRSVDDLDRRIITKVGQLWDCGPVSSPAYLGTSVGLAADRSFDDDDDDDYSSYSKPAWPKRDEKTLRLIAREKRLWQSLQEKLSA